MDMAKISTALPMSGGPQSCKDVTTDTKLWAQTTSGHRI